MKKQPVKITKRAVLYVTKLCNASCKFCYYRFEGIRKHTPLGDIKKKLKKIKEDYSVEYIDITGGEPTIHPHIVHIVKAACNTGIKPTVITNAQKTDIISRLIDNGLEDLLVSVHGFKNGHDEVVGISGAYKKVIKTLTMLKSKSFEFRLNTVLTKYSCRDVESIANAFVEIHPRMVNLISFNPYEGSLWRDKKKIDFQVDYTIQGEAAKKMIDILVKAEIWVNVRYIPLCFMKGYEKHVCNFLQLQYDPYEWEYSSSNRLSKTEIDKLTEEAVAANRFGKTRKEQFYQHMMHNIIKDNKKVTECQGCSLVKICDHVYSQYLNEFGRRGYKKVEGKKIEDPMFFRKLDARWAILKSNKTCE
jgi:MoaA/NifB/PqqE/SkfB family radical SAM enzyme